MTEDQTTTRPTTPAGWYADPTGAAELRYWDGSQWTEHVSSGGEQSTAPLTAPLTAHVSSGGEQSTAPLSAPDDAAVLDIDVITVLRQSQAREDTERPLDLWGDGNWLGRFVPTVDGSVGYRLDLDGSGTVLSVRKPGFKNELQIEQGGGASLGAIAKVGRLHSRYDVAGNDGEPIASAKLASGVPDTWDLRLVGTEQIIATVVRHSGQPDPAHLAAAQYELRFASAANDDLRRLSLAVPVAIDMLDTQTG